MGKPSLSIFSSGIDFSQSSEPGDNRECNKPPKPRKQRVSVWLCGVLAVITAAFVIFLGYLFAMPDQREVLLAKADIKEVKVSRETHTYYKRALETSDPIKSNGSTTTQVVSQPTESTTTKTDSSASLLTILGVFFALALAIERVTEGIVGMFEKSYLSLRKVVSRCNAPHNWMERQYVRALKKVSDVAVELDKCTDDPGKELLDKQNAALKHLAESEALLQSFTQEPDYIFRKRLITMGFNLVVGLVLAFVCGFRVFYILGLDIRTNFWDMFLTGLIIGSGSAPVHYLIGILQDWKEVLKQSGEIKKAEAARQNDSNSSS